MALCRIGGKSSLVPKQKKKNTVQSGFPGMGLDRGFCKLLRYGKSGWKWLKLLEFKGHGFKSPQVLQNEGLISIPVWFFSSHAQEGWVVTCKACCTNRLRLPSKQCYHLWILGKAFKKMMFYGNHLDPAGKLLLLLVMVLALQLKQSTL